MTYNYIPATLFRIRPWKIEKYLNIYIRWGKPFSFMEVYVVYYYAVAILRHQSDHLKYFFHHLKWSFTYVISD